MFVLCLTLALLAPRPAAAQADGSRAFTNATVIDGTGEAPLQEATVVTENGRIDCVGDCEVPPDANVVDVEGKYIIPGLVDAHVHYWLSGWLDTFPGFDVSEHYQMDEAMADLRAHPERFHRSYLCSGVTAVFETGGPPWTLDVRDEAERTSRRTPHYATAGPLLTTFKALPDHPVLGEAFIYMEDEVVVRKAARRLAQDEEVDAIKVHRTDRLDDRERQRTLLEAAAKEAHQAGLPLIANAQTLAAAKTALRAGTDLLIYPVDNTLVDQEFLDLARQNDATYVPALEVSKGAQEVRQRSFDEDRLPLDCVDPKTRRKAFLTDSLPVDDEEGSEVLPARTPTLQTNRKANLRRVHNAGVNVAVGASSGAPLTFHGPATAYEMNAMATAGLSPMEVLVAATRGGAKAMGRLEEFGTLEAGKRADLVVLNRNPLDNIANVRSIVRIVRGGQVWTRKELEYR
jgi:imidazolonepropionase-like amidohydrolase